MKRSKSAKKPQPIIQVGILMAIGLVGLFVILLALQQPTENRSKAYACPTLLTCYHPNCGSNPDPNNPSCWDKIMCGNYPIAGCGSYGCITPSGKDAYCLLPSPTPTPSPSLLPGQIGCSLETKPCNYATMSCCTGLVCKNLKCIQPECTHGDTRCVGGTQIQKCNGGIWEFSKNCTACVQFSSGWDCKRNICQLRGQLCSRSQQINCCAGFTCVPLDPLKPYAEGRCK